MISAVQWSWASSCLLSLRSAVMVYSDMRENWTAEHMSVRFPISSLTKGMDMIRMFGPNHERPQSFGLESLHYFRLDFAVVVHNCRRKVYVVLSRLRTPESSSRRTGWSDDCLLLVFMSRLKVSRLSRFVPVPVYGVSRSSCSSEVESRKVRTKLMKI